MNFSRVSSIAKPPLGLSLGAGTLVQGLQLALLLNEFGGQAFRDLRGRYVGTVGGGVLTNDWAGTHQGLGFRQTSNGPYIDYGLLSQFAIGSRISFAALLPYDNNPIGTAQGSTRAFLASSGFAISFGISDVKRPANVNEGWVCQVNTVANPNGIAAIATPSLGTTALYAQVADLIVGVYDGVNVKAYVNGVLNATSAADSSGLSPTQTDHVTLTGWAANTQSFNQPIVFAALWNRDLQPAEVQQLQVEMEWALVPQRRGLVR